MRFAVQHLLRRERDSRHSKAIRGRARGIKELRLGKEDGIEQQHSYTYCSQPHTKRNELD